MGYTTSIILCLLIQLGLLGSMAAEGECCPQAGLEHTHAESHDHHDTEHDSDRGCSENHPAPDKKNCPSDCGEHHHHGTCIHSMQLSHFADGHCRLDPPRSLMMGCDRLRMRVPDGPVFEMDKPPLI